MQEKDLIREMAKLEIVTKNSSELEVFKEKTLTQIAHFIIACILKAKLVDQQLPCNLVVTKSFDFNTYSRKYALITTERFTSDRNICFINGSIIDKEREYFNDVIVNRNFLRQLSEYVENHTLKTNTTEKLSEISSQLILKEETFWSRLWKNLL